MATSKPTDLDEYRERHILPYATQMFGVYQPLLGLRSRLTQGRIDQAAASAVKQVITTLAGSSAARKLHETWPGPIGPDTLLPSQPPSWLTAASAQGQVAFGGAVAGAVQYQYAASMPGAKATLGGAFAPSQPMQGGVGPSVQGVGTMQYSQAGNVPGALAKLAGAAAPAKPMSAGGTMTSVTQGQGVHDAVVAGTMQYVSLHNPSLAEKLANWSKSVSLLAKMKPYIDPLAHFDPDTQAALLSPIGLVQLYRQYFFELDSFLGPPVGHVWVSPGGSLEVYEVHTRKRTETREVEQSSESKSSSETSSQEQDDISTAMSRDNSENMSLGVTAQAGVNFGVFSASASTSYNTGNTQKLSEQTAHKETRSQSSKISSELRKSYKTTFKTTLEQTDMQSRRYVLSNRTDKLVNYELCRKMRKVGVQVQHIGTQLCWQVFVDNPGYGLRLSDLVHLAQPADLSGLQPPEAAPVLSPKEETREVTFPFIGKGDNTDNDEDYDHGTAIGLPPMAVGYNIEHVRTFKVAPPAPGYTLDHVDMISFRPSDPSADDVYVVPSFAWSKTGFDIYLDKVNFDGAPSLVFKLRLLWAPPARTQADEEAFRQKMMEFKAEEQRLIHTAYVNAVRERVKAAGQIAKRPEGDLRAEERIVVYRQLLSQLVRPAEDYASNNQVAHVTSELIRALFDVDSMLYFVAPDWWKPRAPGGSSPPTGPHLTNDDLVGWGGAQAHRRGNYLVTEESAPAPMGASLGWTLQLDGDDRRNTFLNAPWVKAVIPIRPGMEEAALNWLTKAHVEGTDGLDATYVGDEPELKGKKLCEALKTLAHSLRNANTSIEGTLKTEKVYEKGFDPLETGFQATGTAYEIFDQWVEVLPTDQVVAVEYMPKKV